MIKTELNNKQSLCLFHAISNPARPGEASKVVAFWKLNSFASRGSRSHAGGLNIFRGGLESH